MADTSQGHSCPEVASAKCEGSDVIDLCSVSSGDEDGGAVGSPSVHSDATLSDADSVAEGC